VKGLRGAGPQVQAELAQCAERLLDLAERTNGKER
jgi:hypothetical protein